MRAADRAGAWRQYPLCLALVVAPLLFGSVSDEGQAAVGLLLAVGWLRAAGFLSAGTRSCSPPSLRWAVLFILLAPLVPLPAWLVQVLSPQRLALARAFPVQVGDTPAWLPLTLSPADSLRRLWVLSLLFSVFWLARHAAGQAGFARRLAVTLGLALLFLAASNVWYRLHSHEPILGLWKVSWGKGAGTFANRNHFADWVYVASLAALGWLLRSLNPLRAARSQTGARVDRLPADALFLLPVVGFALIMAFLSGSRGGLLAFLGGLAAWVLLLARRSRRRSRWVALGLLAVAALLVILPASEPILRRLAAARLALAAPDSKLAIWRESFALFLKFPLVGTGWGAFAIAFDHFKTIGGLSTFLHAENDYLELLVETGLVGALTAGTAVWFIFRSLGRLLWRQPVAEPELLFGAAAGLAAFAVHALAEFVFQIPANALLAAALLGFCLGTRDQVGRPSVIAPLPTWRITLNLAWSLALFAIAGCQALGVWQWRQALNQSAPLAVVDHLRRSIRLWPWAADRQIALVRAQVRLFGNAPLRKADRLASPVRAQIGRALRRDPFNWQLRLERAWLDLAFSTNRPRALAEVWETVRLNPHQPQIPLRFANYFADRDPDQALALLRAADFSSAAYLSAGLALAWHIRPDPALLWELTPDSAAGLLTLGDFAVGERLFPLAAQAYGRLSHRIDPAELAARLKQLPRPDQTTQPGSASP